jgi:hypothetical protein
VTTPKPDEPRRWLEHPRAAAVTYRALVVVCAALAALDFTYHKHVHYGFEDWYGFYGAYGFIACVSLVLVAKELRKVVKRDEDYYD